jgi:hypothetical protein
MSSTQILTFDNFGALEIHLRSLKSRHAELIKKYEEALGSILRETSRVANPKAQKVQEKWAVDMQQALASAKDKKVGAKASPPAKKPAAAKEKPEAPAGEWIALDPMSVFVGPKNRGMAEIYFDTINALRDNTGKINLALSICNTLKAKAATSGSTSLIVSFVNDIPAKMVLKPTDEGMAKKYSMTFSFAVPVAQALASMQH